MSNSGDRGGRPNCNSPLPLPYAATPLRVVILSDKIIEKRYCVTCTNFEFVYTVSNNLSEQLGRNFRCVIRLLKSVV